MDSNGKCAGCGHGTCTDYGDVIHRYERRPSNLIPVLHELQDRVGYLSAEAMQEVSKWLSVPLSDVYGTATFYTMFATKRKGEHVIRLCESPPCHIEGSKGVQQALEQALGIKPGDTTEDGMFSLELVSCFGLCGVAPAIMVDRDAYGNLTPDMVPEILSRYRRGEA